MDMLPLRSGFSSPGFDQGKDSEFDRAVNLIWDALRVECCASGLDASAVVLLRKPDLIAAMRRVAVKQAI